MSEYLLVLISFATSLFTAVLGLGGGLLLIALMPGLLPAAAIIPIHAATQLTSNASRALFAWREIRWDYTLSFIIGSVIGGGLASSVAHWLNLDYLPLFIAAFILFNVWGGGLKIAGGYPGEFGIIGFLQTGLGMLVGATGPLGQSALLKHGLHKDALVATTAVFMTITHLIKLALFGLLGFSFADYWPLMLAMMGAVTLGSWFGTKLRRRVPSGPFQLILKWLLTLLAIRMILLVLLA